VSVNHKRGPSDRLRLAVIGTGQIAQSAHLPSAALNADVDVVALVEPDDARAAEAARRFAIAKRYRAGEDLFDADDVDAVLVLTPKQTHATLVTGALMAGLDVLVEKPLTTELGDAHRLQSLAGQRGQVLMVGFNRRFSPLYQRAYEHVRDARPQMIVAQKHRPGTEYRATLENAIHMVDLMRWFGGDTVGVQAGSQAPDLFHEDGCAALVTFSSGGLGVLAAARTSSEWVERLDVHGGGRSATVQSPTTVRLVSSSGATTFAPANEPPGWVRPTYVHGFEAQLDHFVACVRSRSQPLTSAGEAIATQALADEILIAAGLPTADLLAVV
jgi:virulence factor